MASRTASSLGALLAISVLISLSGCGDDGSPPPADSSVDTTADSGGDDGGVDCATAVDGTSCGGELICLRGTCVPSDCGDGYVDTIAGEVCDDGNDVPGDGCEPGDCTPSCTVDADCADEDPCNGAETCNTALNRCQAGTGGDGEDCTLAEGGVGVCAAGVCAPPGCGNSVVDGAEDCDDGMNGDNNDGCRDDCAFTCDEETLCADSDPCNGNETCDLSSHTCNPGTALDCDDSDPCTADSCETDVGCRNELIDVDGDGYAPGTCTTGGLMGGDCNDTAFSVYPGAPESCDGIDNDCDGTVDDGTVDIDCYHDADGDGYGDDGDVVTTCSCPPDYIVRGGDCEDDLPDVNPDHVTYESDYYCIGGASTCVASRRSWDWDCSGTEERRYTSTYSGCGYGPPGCTICYCTGSGWSDSIPDCGRSASYTGCTIGLGCSVSGTSSRTQTCR